MKRILKFTLTPWGVNSIETLDNPRWLSVEWQGEELVAWCEAEVGYSVRSNLYAVLTGAPVPLAGTYLGTAQHPTLLDGGPFVVHVYVIGESNA
jgi:hypothetical protein